MDKYYCMKQHDITDCGAACLATISKQHGFTTSITKIREVADPAKGIVKLSPEAFFGKIHEEDVLVKQNCNTSV